MTSIHDLKSSLLRSICLRPLNIRHKFDQHQHQDTRNQVFVKNKVRTVSEIISHLYSCERMWFGVLYFLYKVILRVSVGKNITIDYRAKHGTVSVDCVKPAFNEDFNSCPFARAPRSPQVPLRTTTATISNK